MLFHSQLLIIAVDVVKATGNIAQRSAIKQQKADD